MTLARICNLVARFAGVAALALGLALWSGRLYELINLHMVLGAAVVISLWGLAAISLSRGLNKALSATALLWGLLTIGLGIGQTNLLPGDQHWMIQVVHLVVGVAAIGMAAILARNLIGVRPNRANHS